MKFARERNFRSVYVIAAPEGAAKIGIAANPAQRLSNLQASNPQQISLHKYWWVIKGEGAKRIEQAVLRAAKAAGHHISGEWLRLPPEQIGAMALAEAGRLGYEMVAPEVIEAKYCDAARLAAETRQKTEDARWAEFNASTDAELKAMLSRPRKRSPGYF